MQLLHEELEGCVVDLNVLLAMREDDLLRVIGYGRGADGVAGVMIEVWNLGRGPVTAVAKLLVVHTHLVLEQTQRRVHHLSYADEPEVPWIERASQGPRLNVDIVISAILVIEAMIDVLHQHFVLPHVFHRSPFRYSKIIAHTIAGQHLIERLPDKCYHPRLLVWEDGLIIDDRNVVLLRLAPILVLPQHLQFLHHSHAPILMNVQEVEWLYVFWCCMVIYEPIGIIALLHPDRMAVERI